MKMLKALTEFVAATAAFLLMLAVLLAVIKAT